MTQEQMLMVFCGLYYVILSIRQIRIIAKIDKLLEKQNEKSTHE